MLLHLAAPDYQPTFTDKRNTPIPLPYTIESSVFGSTDSKLHGWLIKSTSIAPEATILFLHGNGGNILSEYPVVLPFVEQGFQIYIFDYRGYGLSDGTAKRKYLYQDATDALEFLKRDSVVSTLPIAIYGQSMGGYIAALIANVANNRVSAIVIEGGFLSYKKIGGETIGSKLLAKLLIREAASPIDSLNRFSGPVLIIHSDSDRVVPSNFGEELFSKRVEPKYFMKIEGSHGNGPIIHGLVISARIKELVFRGN
jgi:pimeloyl-ACP methyl ester carboxylesterase